MPTSLCVLHCSPISSKTILPLFEASVKAMTHQRVCMKNLQYHLQIMLAAAHLPDLRVNISVAQLYVLLFTSVKLCQKVADLKIVPCFTSKSTLTDYCEGTYVYRSAMQMFKNN